MSATSHATGSPVCGAWMPRKKTYCARGAGHTPPCKSPEAMAYSGTIRAYLEQGRA